MSEVKKTKKKGSFKNYFRDMKLELKKVTWLTKQELIKYTLTVLIVTAIIAAIIFVFDKIVIAFLSLFLHK